MSEILFGALKPWEFGGEEGFKEEILLFIFLSFSVLYSCAC